MDDFEKQSKQQLFNNKTQQMVVAIAGFLELAHVQYGLFDNRMRRDKVRKAMYNIKDDFGKNSVRKASETIQHNVMTDAIGFGSVKDLYTGGHFNHYLLEEDIQGAKKKRTPRQTLNEQETTDWDINQDTDALIQAIGTASVTAPSGALENATQQLIVRAEAPVETPARP